MSLPDQFRDQCIFFLKLRYWPDFNSPKTFSEKLHHWKYYHRDSRTVSLSDKMEVRNYVANKVGEQFLIPLKYAGTELSPATLSGLDGNIVVKRNNESGRVWMLIDPVPEEVERICAEASFDRDYGRETNEWWYREIPMRILVEKKLGETDWPPVDYKFFCFNRGADLFVEIVERQLNGYVYSSFFDESLQPVQFDGSEVRRRSFPSFNGDLPARDAFEEMKTLARQLASEFEFVRVDLYYEGKQPWFGELTFCPSTGRCDFTPAAFDLFLGQLWNLEIKPSQDFV